MNEVDREMTLDVQRQAEAPPSDEDNLIIEEAYTRFPDEIEPVDYHPAGKIVVDRGNLRFAFLEGARFAVADMTKDGKRR